MTQFMVVPVMTRLLVERVSTQSMVAMVTIISPLGKGADLMTIMNQVSNSLMLVRVMIIYREEIIKKFLLVMVMTRFLEGSVI